MAESLCSRCGSSAFETLSPTESRCAECGLGRSSQPLRRLEPGEAVDPQLAELMREHRALMENPLGPFTEASFAPFGLDERWAGLRWLGGSGRSDHVVNHLELAHGDDPYDPDRPIVRVDTWLPPAVHADPEPNLALQQWFLTQQQVGTFWRQTGTLPPEVRAAAFATGEEPGDPTAPWDAVDLAVDGEVVGFRVLADQGSWVAQARQGPLLVGITAHRWGVTDTGLVTVGAEALLAYERGSQQIAARRPRIPGTPDSGT